MEKDELLRFLYNAIKNDFILKKIKINVRENEALLRISGGDARKLLNAFELVINAETAEDFDPEKDQLTITNEIVIEKVQENIALYDKNGEYHYDIISAFIKSIRGSDPNAAVYWLARMLEGGEDVKFIARRLVILSSEDIGLANPNALLLATSCFQSVNTIGMPEARIILSETAIYLATSPKSNSAYMAIENALEFSRQTGDLSVPLHLRNAPTGLMKQLNYGKDYKYAHRFEGHFTDLEFLPEKISGKVFYDPQENAKEKEIRTRLSALWKKKYGYDQ